MKFNPLAVFLLILLCAGCSKKKQDSQASDTSTVPELKINYDLPVIRGRSLDSLKSQKYVDRILAFSIELGFRSRDFNQRLGLMLAGTSGREHWNEEVAKNIASENYIRAESYNKTYLDSLRKLLTAPPDEFRQSFLELTASYERLKNNYAVLRDHEKFKTMTAILDTVLTNEFAINRTLKDFERKMGNK